MKTYIARILCPGLATGPVMYEIRARSKPAARQAVAKTFPSGLLERLDLVG